MSLQSVAQHRVPLVTFLIGGLSWVVLGGAPSFLGAGDGLTSQRYGDERIVWTGYLSVEHAGAYDFGFTSDDDARLSLDNHEMLDFRADRPGSPKSGSVTLAAGSHRILVERVKPGEAPALDLVWARHGEGHLYQPVPVRTLSRRPLSNRTMRLLSTLEWMRIASAIVAAFVTLWFLYDSIAKRRDTWMAWGAPYRNNPTAYFLLLALVSAGLALGGRYGLWQFVYWLPGFNFIRGSSRFMVLGLLGVAVLAGVGFDWLTARLSPSPRRLAAIVVGSLLVAEFSAIPYTGVPYRLDIPAADLWVARQQKPFSVAEVPVTTSERYQSNYMLHSMAHWQKTVHGFSGIRPALHEELYDQLRTFPSEDSVRHLAQLEVTYVIVHSSWFPAEERRLVEERLPAFGSWLTLEYMDPVSRVYSIHRPQKKES